jgi:galactose oxidase-like protein
MSVSSRFARAPRLLRLTREATLLVALVVGLCALTPAQAARAQSASTGEWSQIPSPFPAERDQPGMACDAVRGQLVLFGGNNADEPYQRNDTWIWDGMRWTEQAPPIAPSPRSLVAIAFHPATGVVVLFGGFDRFGPGGGALGDTWTWDGARWIELAPAVSPPPRYGAALALDPASGKLLLFGGYGQAERNDTWTWDGVAWHQESPSASPPARVYPGMAPHAADGTLVLFGGYNFFLGGSLDDTWVWSAGAWTQAVVTAPPPARAFAPLAPDVSGNVVMFGGQLAVTQNLADTWTWDGQVWTPQATSSPPPARAAHALAYDAARGQVLLFGGRAADGASIDYLDDTWWWDGAAWDEPPIGKLPPRRAEMGIAYDAGRDQVVVFGGWNHMEDLDDTWVWNGQGWSPRAPAVSPSARSLGGMSYDAERGEIVLFGGSRGGVRLAETWTWDGIDWTLRSPATSPSPRYGGTMAYDGARKEVVLFGGSAVGGYSAETWIWDGVTWTQRLPATSPPPRYRAGMAYDAGRRRMVLFGGLDPAFNLLGDTWSWDGTTWRLETPAASPSPRYSPGLGYDALGDAVVLFGGTGLGGPEDEHQDTWTWNGAQWTEQHPWPTPSGRFSTGLVHFGSGAAAGLLLFGGSSLTEGAQRDTWIWRDLGDPTSVLVSVLRAEAGDGYVRLLWQVSDHGLVARLARRREAEGWTVIAQPSADGAGRIAYQDRDVERGARYAYRLGIPGAAGELHLGEVEVMVPPCVLALDGLRSNPARGELVATFSLPHSGAGRLDLFDLAGRRVRACALQALNAGRHSVRIGDAGEFAPGVYLLRLTQDGRSVAKRIVVGG